MKALELAQALDDAPYSCGLTNEAADELRRLAEVNAELLEALDFYGRFILKHKDTGAARICTPIDHDGGDRARNAIAKAKEQQ